jgi:hypothetical protein
MRARSTPSLRCALPAVVGAALAIAAPGEARATEKQSFVGATLAYGYLDEHYQWFSGFGVAGEYRYGLNDAIDLELDASLFSYPTGQQIVPSTSAGIVYVLDVSKFIPQVGATFGVHDLVTYACPDEGSRPCGHEVYPSISLPAAFDYRVTKHLSLGAHFRYTFLLGGTASSEIAIGGAIAFSTAEK